MLIPTPHTAKNRNVNNDTSTLIPGITNNLVLYLLVIKQLYYYLIKIIKIPSLYHKKKESQLTIKHIISIFFIIYI